MPTGSIIDKREIIRLVKKYKKDGGHNNNTKSVWFSLGDLVKIMSLISNLDDQTTNKTGDGVRIYFSRYTKKNSSSVKKEKNTLVFVPTYNLNGGAIHYDFITEQEVKDISTEIGDPDTDAKAFDDGYNHGQLCPTYCDGANIGENV